VSEERFLWAGWVTEGGLARTGQLVEGWTWAARASVSPITTSLCKHGLGVSTMGGYNMWPVLTLLLAQKVHSTELQAHPCDLIPQLSLALFLHTHRRQPCNLCS
jgi:hypothetical protein